ncbi:MAG: hypothetical protein ACK2TV_01290 [Anaerolineales bacterium]
MNIFLTIVRITAAILIPLLGFILAFLAFKMIKGKQGWEPEEDQRCLRCGLSRIGAHGTFHYLQDEGNAHNNPNLNQRIYIRPKFVLTEKHFICDYCAQRYLRNEALQGLFMVILYPVYYVILQIFKEYGITANFLIEILLIVLSLTGITSIFELFRAIRSENAPLAEARDRVAIVHRKKHLGKKFRYFTRSGTTQLKK